RLRIRPTWRRGQRRRSRPDSEAVWSSIPPAAAERLEQRGRIGEPTRLGLHARDQRLLVCLTRTQERQVADGAELLLLERDVERALGRLLGGDCGLEAVGIRLERIQRIRHVLEARQ